MDSSGQPSIWVKVGVLAGGLAALALFAVRPMYQVLQNEQSVSITFKGVILGAMLTMVGLNLLLLGDRGIPWKKTEDQPLTPLQKGAIAATIVGALLITGLVWLFFNQHGYSMSF